MFVMFVGRIFLYPFWSTTHFLDLQFRKEDHKITSRLLNDIVQEGFYITKYTNTSYADLDKITPLERRMLIKFIADDIAARNKAHEEAMKTIKEL